MDQRTESILREAGLTEGEIKVYLALVELGKVTVGPIIKEAKVSGSKIYMILEKLIQKGLVNYIIKEKTKYFQIAQPISLLDYLDQKEQKIKQTKLALNEVIEKIKLNQQFKKEREEARIYRGFKGLKTGIFEAIKTIPKDGNYYFFSTGYETVPYLKRFFSKITIELNKKNIKIKGLAHKSEKKNFVNKKNYHVKFTDIKWPSDIGIIGNQLTFIVWDQKEPVLYIIQSKVLVDSYSIFFNDIWNKAK